jgi:hypothetical protein
VLGVKRQVVLVEFGDGGFEREFAAGDLQDVIDVSARLMAAGSSAFDRRTSVEDYATALIALSGGIVLNLACSWNLHAGRDAIIKATIYGTEGAWESAISTARSTNSGPSGFAARHARRTRGRPTIGAAELLHAGRDGWQRAPPTTQTTTNSSGSPRRWIDSAQR